MRWDQCEQDDLEEQLPARSRRPSAEGEPDVISHETRGRHPDVQAEIQRRVAIYTQQFEQQGHITWLPYRGNGN